MKNYLGSRQEKKNPIVDLFREIIKVHPSLRDVFLEEHQFFQLL
jgi:hypothetical protein